MKIICTTSNSHLHILPIFCHLFNKYWDNKQVVEIVGYSKPNFDLPINFKFHSLGKQTDNKKDFSNDLMKYFNSQDDWFIWTMEDTFIKDYVDFKALETLAVFADSEYYGRINLSGECVCQKHIKHCTVNGFQIYENTPHAEYRLSTQISMWNKNFLLKYLTPDLSPWEFETQKTHEDGYKIIGLDRKSCPVKHNEGVRRFDLRKYNFEGFDEETIEELSLII